MQRREAVNHRIQLITDVTNNNYNYYYKILGSALSCTVMSLHRHVQRHFTIIDKEKVKIYKNLE